MKLIMSNWRAFCNVILGVYKFRDEYSVTKKQVVNQSLGKLTVNLRTLSFFAKIDLKIEVVIPLVWKDSLEET